ncbi:MAG: MarR family transcriptional regulator [Burkholderiales bacterium]|nr:MarR family transcriptional regulator [Burkholderiales bacterium]
MNNQTRITPEEREAYVADAHERLVGEKLGDVRINILVKTCSAIMLDYLGRQLAPYALSTTGYLAMMMIFSHPENLVNPSELSAEMRETRGNVTRICDELVKQGYIRRVTNLEDRRRVDLSLTDEGIALLQKVVPVLRKQIETVYAVFSEEEKATLYGLLGKLYRSFELKS